MNLTKSIARTWCCDEALHVYKSPRSLQSRLRNGRLGISKLKRRSDVCALCQSWKGTIVKGIANSLKNFFEDASSILPAYKDIWEAWLRGNRPEWLDKTNAMEDPDFYCHLKKYVDAHADTYPSMRASLSEERLERLQAIERKLSDSLTGDEGMEGCVAFASWHWSLKEWLQARFWQEWYEPKEGELYLLFDYKENGTLPQGPEANAAEWRANARLGYSCFGVCVWKRGFRRWFFYLSRCMEHTSAATIAYLDDLWVDLEEQLRGVERICTWSDGGSHFRSNAFLAYMGTTVTSRLRKHTSVAYGVVSHFKNPCDGEFGGFSKRVEEDAAENKLIVISHIVEGMGRLGSQHVHKDFFPPPKADVVVERLKRSCMPCGVHASHYWEFRIRDARRPGLEGRATPTGRPFTGIVGKALRLPGIRAVPEAAFEPVLELHPDDEEDDEIENVDEEVAGESQLEINSSSHLGWRTSYRTVEAEKVCPKKWRASLKRKYDSMSVVHGSIPRAGRQKSFAARLAATTVQRDRKKARQEGARAAVAAASG